MKVNADMTIPSSAVALNLEFHLGLMEKQIKRLAELARFLPFANQQEEMNKDRETAWQRSYIVERCPATLGRLLTFAEGRRARVLTCLVERRRRRPRRS
jgi:hypothetical protein